MCIQKLKHMNDTNQSYYDDATTRLPVPSIPTSTINNIDTITFQQ